MRQLLPHPADHVDVGARYGVDRPRPEDRPWVVSLMASSVDGAVAVDGRSGVLGGPGDQLVFRAVRAVADAIVVGSGTVAAERYGPVRSARLVIVSGRLSLEPAMRVFAEAEADDVPPLIAHGPSAPADRRDALRPVAELLEVDAGAPLLAALHQRGHRVVVLEGGPTLNGRFVDDDLVDELCLTLDPRVVGGPSPRIVSTQAPAALRDWIPAHLLEHDGSLFWRLLRAR